MSSKSILFADDSATMRAIIEKTFSAEPYDVTVVPSGEAAIMKAREIHPDIIIADAGMAGVSGYDVCKAVQGDTSLAGTPFIMMAGVSNPYNETRGSQVGVNKYVKKPFDTTQLIETVSNLASKSRPSTSVTPGIDPQRASFNSPLGLSSDKSPLGLSSDKSPLGLSSERPIVVPTGPKPIATPIAKPPVKKTMEFGATSMKQSSGGGSLEIDRLEPSVPMDLPKAPEQEIFQAATLAEMAQLDKDGAPIPRAAAPDSIDIPLSPPTSSKSITEQPASVSPQAATALPIAEAIQQRAHVAASEIEKGVDGLTADQVEAIRVLTTDVVERVVWEIVPQLAETIIREEIAQLLKE